jgi:hypothetical protein
MIKLKQLVRESLDSARPNKSLDLYVLNTLVKEFEGTVYHGSPREGLKDMIVQGIYGTQHGEMAEYETLSTSVNSEVLHMFSEGHGDTGISFDVKGIKLVVLDQFLTKLMAELPGSGMDPEVDDEAAFNAFCEHHKVPRSRFGGDYCLPYNYLSSLGVDAFTYDYVWTRIDHGMPPSPRDESEIAFIGNGLKKLNKMVSEIWVDGQTYEPTEQREALAAIAAET